MAGVVCWIFWVEFQPDIDSSSSQLRVNGFSVAIRSEISFALS